MHRGWGHSVLPTSSQRAHSGWDAHAAAPPWVPGDWKGQKAQLGLGGASGQKEVFSACTYCCQSSTMSLCHFYNQLKTTHLCTFHFGDNRCL